MLQFFSIRNILKTTAMRKIYLVILFLNITSWAFAQVISGVVLDNITKKSIDYAVIYINGTFIGTHADKEGHFKLDISKSPSMPITISALGYQSVIINEPQINTNLYVFLTPKVIELNEVIVSARESSRARRARKAHMKQFKYQFLGLTTNATKCKILNEDDIRFSYDSKSGILKAYSSNPIIIINNGLGYKISYFLDQFEYRYSNNSLILTGNIKFDENLSTSISNNKIFERRRKAAYLGSRMHFFRTLWNNELNQSDFTIFNNLKQKMGYDSLVVQTNDTISQESKKYLKSCQLFYISYYSQFINSVVTFTKDTVYFEKNGYFYVLGLSWAGEMAKQRIAEELPFEYIPK